MKLIQILMLAAMAATAGWSADPDSWDAVTRIPAGASVEVIHSGLERTEGSFANATGEAIVVSSASGAVRIARGDVRRVSVRGASRKKRALLGAAIGAGLGAAAFAIGAHSGDIDIRRDLVTGAGAVAGGGIGAALGAATGGLKTVYRSQP
jgi:uncharacterized protein YcfJ